MGGFLILTGLVVGAICAAKKAKLGCLFSLVLIALGVDLIPEEPTELSSARIPNPPAVPAAEKPPDPERVPYSNRLKKPKKTKADLAKKKKPLSEEAACRVDLQCWGDKHSLRATRPCQRVIEQLAQYDYEWTDGWGVKS